MVLIGSDELLVLGITCKNVKWIRLVRHRKRKWGEHGRARSMQTMLSRGTK